jgi:6-phosphogluconolactonase
MTMHEHGRRSRSHKTGKPGRRDFLKGSAVVASAGLAAVSGVATAARGRSQPESRRAPGYHGYVSFQDDNRISICTVDPATGRLAWQEDVAVDGGPAPLAINPAGNILYVGKRVSDEIASYRIDKSTGGLSFVGTVPLQGEPVHLATDRTGRFVLSAYWHQSTVAVHAVDGNGVATFPPIEWRFTAPGAHAIQSDPSNRFVFVPHTARPGQPNGIFQFRFDEMTGRLTPNDPPLLELQATLGPRHICFHPTRDVVYSSDEQGSSVTAYALDPATGKLAPFQTISSLPGGASRGRNTCSQIQIHPSGRFLYVPNRGHESIASFSIDASSGRLTATGWVPTEPRPRVFSLDPEGRFLFVAGRESGQLASYEVDQDSGVLTPLEIYEGGNAPLWVLITRLTA